MLCKAVFKLLDKLKFWPEKSWFLQSRSTSIPEPNLIAIHPKDVEIFHSKHQIQPHGGTKGEVNLIVWGSWMSVPNFVLRCWHISLDKWKDWNDDDTSSFVTSHGTTKVIRTPPESSGHHVYLYKIWWWAIVLLLRYSNSPVTVKRKWSVQRNTPPTRGQAVACSTNISKLSNNTTWWSLTLNPTNSDLSLRIRC